jgi:hypothetical protein
MGTVFLTRPAQSVEHYKDAILDVLGETGNVAQFVSFSPTLDQRYSRITGRERNHRFDSSKQAISSLMSSSVERRINLRSFDPKRHQGNEFIYGLQNVDAALQELERLTSSGLHVIANETIDVNDGGVSGVAQGDLLEFAPGGTPRVVESAGITSISRSLGTELLSKVYGFLLDLPEDRDLRIEFSIHPLKRGFRQAHTVLWEVQEIEHGSLDASLNWPNTFSQFIGDKTFGLLIADCLGWNVPYTTVISRGLPPFSFGRMTEADMKWMRTSPRKAEPGYFPTYRGWRDPFKMIAEEGSEERLAAVLVQSEVPSVYSGAVITGVDEKPIVEGVAGFGDRFMMGEAAPVDLPPNVLLLLNDLHDSARAKLGSVRLEWAFDGRKVWVIQLQKEEALSNGSVIVPGNFGDEVTFDPRQGLDELRSLIERVQDKGCSIRVRGNIGMTSHMADVLRRSRIPSRIVHMA